VVIAEQTLTKHVCNGWAGKRKFATLWIAAPDADTARAEYTRAIMRRFWIAVDRVLVNGVELPVEIVCEVKILRDGREVIFR
jgi:hypothetical protein